MRVVVSLFLILLVIGILGILLVGMHGRLMFRPHMLEDWILWGAAVAASVGAYVMNRRRPDRN